MKVPQSNYIENQRHWTKYKHKRPGEEELRKVKTNQKLGVPETDLIVRTQATGPVGSVDALSLFSVQSKCLLK